MNENHIYRIQTQRGQTMLEYLLLIALIAVGSIGIVTILGDTLRVKIQNAANRLAGESESIDARQVVKDSDGKVRRNIGNFNH
jgi:Flp pilus assembly pilin Flp